MTDNAAVLQQRVTKGTNPFLSTLAEPGEAQFLTVLKPCGILLPHTHQRANEFYSVIFGTPPRLYILSALSGVPVRRSHKLMVTCRWHGSHSEVLQPMRFSLHFRPQPRHTTSSLNGFLRLQASWTPVSLRRTGQRRTSRLRSAPGRCLSCRRA